MEPGYCMVQNGQENMNERETPRVFSLFSSTTICCSYASSFVYAAIRSGWFSFSVVVELVIRFNLVDTHSYPSHLPRFPLSTRFAANVTR